MAAPGNLKGKMGWGSVPASLKWVHFLVDQGHNLLEDLGWLFCDLGKPLNTHVIWLLDVHKTVQGHMTRKKVGAPQGTCTHRTWLFLPGTFRHWPAPRPVPGLFGVRPTHLGTALNKAFLRILAFRTCLLKTTSVSGDWHWHVHLVPSHILIAGSVGRYLYYLLHNCAVYCSSHMCPWQTSETQVQCSIEMRYTASIVGTVSVV